MANRKNKVQGWGIAQVGLNGELTLVYAAMDRDTVRDHKREVYPGNAYKTVKINATFEPYSK